MRTQLLTKKMNSRNLFLTGFAAIALFLVSCEKAEDDYMAEEINAMQEEEALKRAAIAPTDLTIVDLAGGNDDFSILVSALAFVDDELDAGLIDMFSSNNGQYTVFAPNNQAFIDLTLALIANGTIDDNLFELGPEFILEVLLYHVTDGRRAANSVVPKTKFKTIQTELGQKFFVDPDGVITANNSSATIIDPNLSASNGIIHEIDAVLVP